MFSFHMMMNYARTWASCSKREQTCCSRSLDSCSAGELSEHVFRYLHCEWAHLQRTSPHVNMDKNPNELQFHFLNLKCLHRAADTKSQVSDLVWIGASLRPRLQLECISSSMFGCQEVQRWLRATCWYFLKRNQFGILCRASFTPQSVKLVFLARRLEVKERK